MAGGTPLRSLALYPCFLNDFLRADSNVTKELDGSFHGVE